MAVRRNSRRRTGNNRSVNAPVHPRQGPRLLLRIGGLTIAVTADPGEMRLGVEGPLRRFVVAEGEPDCVVRARFGPTRREARGELLFDSGSLWQLRRDDLLAPVMLGAWAYAALLAGFTIMTMAMFREFNYAFIYFQF